MSTTNGWNPWRAPPGLSFRESEVAWLLHLNTRRFTAKERQTVWHNITGRTSNIRALWHFPAPPFAWLDEENDKFLLPKVYYNFEKQVDSWVFSKLTFSSIWKWDPRNGNTIVPLGRWVDLLNLHRRNSRPPSLIIDFCYFEIFRDGLCTCNHCPAVARRYSNYFGPIGAGRPLPRSTSLPQTPPLTPDRSTIPSPPSPPLRNIRHYSSVREWLEDFNSRQHISSSDEEGVGSESSSIDTWDSSFSDDLNGLNGPYGPDSDPDDYEWSDDEESMDDGSDAGMRVSTPVS